MYSPMSTKNRVIFSFIAGIICVILGGAPLLKLNLLNTIPQVFSPFVIKIALFISGLILLYDGMQLKNPMTGMIKGTSIIGGFFLAVIGAIPIVIDLGWFNKQLPFIATLTISPSILQLLLVFFGFYLLYDAYLLSRQFF